MNRDELDGKATNAKGKMKEAAGDLTGNDRLREEGAADQAMGKTEETFGKAKRKVGDALDVSEQSTPQSAPSTLHAAASDARRWRWTTWPNPP